MHAAVYLMLLHSVQGEDRITSHRFHSRVADCGVFEVSTRGNEWYMGRREHKSGWQRILEPGLSA